MRAIHKSTLHALCPVDKRWDYYTVTVESDGLVEVEKIEVVLDKFRGVKFYQETLAEEIARLLPGCTITLEGRHGKQTDSVVTERVA